MNESKNAATRRPVQAFVLPVLLKRGMPDEFDVIVGQHDLARVDMATRNAKMAELKLFCETLMRMGYQVLSFNDPCMSTTVYRFRRQNRVICVMKGGGG